MFTRLVETFFELPGDILVHCGHLSVFVFFTFSALSSMMSTFMFVGVLTALILSLIYRFTLPKPDPSLIEKILGDQPVIFGHRGAALDAPENTLSAIRLAKKNQAYGVEIDLSFTKDNIAIVFHDDELDRTTDGKGPLLDYTWEVVKTLDAAKNHIYSDLYKNEKVPTIDQAVEEAMELGLKIILDIKEHDDRTVEYLVNLFDKFPELKNEALVGSFYPQLIYKLRTRRPDIATALIWRRNFLAYQDADGTKPRYENSPLKQFFCELMDPVLEWSIHNFLWHTIGVSAVLIHKDHICKDYVDSWKNKGLKVLSWTPNNPIEKEFLMHLNVSVITDTLR